MYSCNNMLLWVVLQVVSFSYKGGKSQPHLPCITFLRCGVVSTLSDMVEWTPYVEKPWPPDILFHHIMNVNWYIYGWYQLFMQVIICMLCMINSSDNDFIEVGLGEMGYNCRLYKKKIPKYKFIRGQYQIKNFNR